jgi:hypothetical protein
LFERSGSSVVSSVCSVVASVSSVLPVSTVVALLISTPALAQMTGAPTPRYKSEPGMVSTAIPAPLREIGFDQNLD